MERDKRRLDEEEVDGAELNKDDDIEVSPNATVDEEYFSFEILEECKQYLNQSADQLMETHGKFRYFSACKRCLKNILTKIKTRSFFSNCNKQKSN